MRAQAKREQLQRRLPIPRKEADARTPCATYVDVDYVNRESLWCLARMFYFNAKHYGPLCVAGRERIVEDGIGLGSIKQDIWDEDGAHAHAEARDYGKCAAERFAECSAGGESWRCGGRAGSGWLGGG